jgi:hypothetical protein
MPALAAHGERPCRKRALHESSACCLKAWGSEGSTANKRVSGLEREGMERNDHKEGGTASGEKERERQNAGTGAEDGWRDAK